MQRRKGRKGRDIYRCIVKGYEGGRDGGKEGREENMKGRNG